MNLSSLTFSSRPFVAALLILGTFGTLFLRSFNVLSIAGKNILLAGVSLTFLIALLSLQGVKDLLEGKLKVGFWHVVTVLFLAALFVHGAATYGLGRAMADSRYCMWMIWGYIVFETVRARSDNVPFHLKVLRVAGILTICYAFFSIATGFAAKQLTTGGFRYVEEDALAYIAVLFFLVSTRMLVQRRYGLLNLAILTASTVLIFLSAKRAVWGGIVLGLLAQLFVNKMDMRKIAGFVLIAALAAAVLARFSSDNREVLLSRVAVFSDGKLTDPSIFFRFAAWKKVIDNGIRNPLVPGGIGSDFDFELKVLGLKQKFTDVSPHNTVMWVFFKGGVIGLLIYFRLILLTVFRARALVRRFRASGDQESLILATVLYSLIIYGTFASMFWDYFAIASMAIIYWWIIGAINGWHHAELRKDAGAAALAAGPGGAARGYAAPVPA